MPAKFDKIHFIGVGGVSMSALAKLCVKLGSAVSGSDLRYNENFAAVLEVGGDVWLGECAERMPKDCVVVHNAAIGKNNLELTEAKRIGLKILTRQEFLAEIEKLFSCSIAVAGTHGKTTVTAMIESVFEAAGLAYTAHIGGVPLGKDNLIFKGTEIFLTEACEYQRSILSLQPTYAVITNIEYDHPDTYRDMEDLEDTFRHFIEKPSLKWVIMPDTLSYAHTSIYNYAHIVTFGKHGDCVIDSEFEEKGCGCSFRVRYKDYEPFRVTLNICGKHNLINACAAVTMCLVAGVSPKDIKKGLENFKGVKRRFEKKGHLNGAPVYIDYAHHPSEISASIAAAKGMYRGNLYVVFQPHTYSRTASLFREFTDSFDGADYLYLTASFAAREEKTAGLTAYDLYKEIKSTRMFCVYHEKLLPIAADLVKKVKKQDFLLILGAGNVDNLAAMVVERE